LALTGDISMIVNGRQTYTFDGNEYNAETQPTAFGSNPYVHATGTWWTGTLGLNIYIGKQEQIMFNSLVDPSLDVQDVIYVRSNGAKIDRLVIIDSLDIPLNPEGEMSANARTVRIVASGEQILVGG
jgi:OOP family OmpA-OmpF porin